MRRSVRRGDYRVLEAMDIAMWLPRAGLAHRLGGARDIAPRVVQQSANPVATVVAAPVATPLTMDESDPRGQLLMRILAALKQPLERFTVVEGPTPALALEAVPGASSRPVFWFGEGLMPACALCLPALETLLADGEAKRLAWRKLKPWIERLED